MWSAYGLPAEPQPHYSNPTRTYAHTYKYIIYITIKESISTLIYMSSNKYIGNKKKKIPQKTTSIHTLRRLGSYNG